MSESYDVAAIAPGGRQAQPPAAVGGAVTPKRGKRVTRAAREALEGDGQLGSPASVAGVREAGDCQDTDEHPPRLWGAAPDHANAIVSRAIGDVGYPANDHVVDRNPTPVEDGCAGGPADQT